MYFLVNNTTNNYVYNESLLFSPLQTNYVLKHEIMAPSSLDRDFLEVLQVIIGANALFELFSMIFDGISL